VDEFGKKVAVGDFVATRPQIVDTGLDREGHA
jgi:hypothetical protein